MSNIYTGRLLSLETVIRMPAYFRLRIEVDSSDVQKMQRAVRPVTISTSDISGNKLTFTGFVTIEDEVAGIVVSSFNVQ